VEYDSNLDHFNGFVTSIIDGVSCENAFQCTNFEQFKLSLKNKPRANLVNAHAILPILDSNVSATPSVIVVSAYRTDNKIISIDVLKRRLMIYKEFYSKKNSCS